MSRDDLAPILSAYTDWFGPPTRTVRLSGRLSAAPDVAVVVYLPSQDDQKDPEGNLTLLGTAGLGPAMICRDLQCELGIEIQGGLSEDAIEENAVALMGLASVPLETGNRFEMNQVLNNFSFPAFPRFEFAMLLDWDPVDGFRFPAPCHEIGMLRVLPLHRAEVEFVESFADRNEGYLSLFNRGLQEADPDRGPVI